MSTKDIGNLRTRLSFENDNNKSLEGFRRDLKGLRSEMNVARSSGRDYTNSLKGMRSQSDILSRTLKTQQERVKELKHRYDESVKAKGEDAAGTKELASQYNNATAQMNRTENQLKALNEEIRRQESPWTKLGERMTATGDKMQKFGKGMTDFGKSYSMRVTAPIVASGVAMFKASMDYESAFAGVRKTVDATEEQFAELSAGIRAMTKVLPASATEIASVAEAAGQLGIKTENILGFTRVMIDLGEATNMTSETAATEFARFANIVGMSQGDFDKLGSVVVDLGNNLATTEAEIVSMAMRLAGAGAQIGLTEAEIMAFSGALSSVGIAAEAGGSAFSKVMVNMQLAAELGGDDLKAFAKVAGVSAKEFKQAFEKDAAGAMISFIKGLSTAEDRGMSAIAVLDEMGITEVRMRDALLRAAGASDVFTDSIELGSKAWEENTALTEEAEQRYGTTESQLKIMWNRIKDVAITMGDALVPAVMSTLDAAEPLIKQIESGAKAFSEMDEEQQRTILKFIALAAAIGPASIMLGGITTTAGGLLKVGGSVATMLGAKGGAGLIGRIGLMGLGGPVGLAVGGVAALAGVVYLLNRDMEKLHDINYELIDSINDEIIAMDEQTDSFEALHGKNKLSTDEMLRLMDVIGELKTATNQDVIASLSKEQEDLYEKSGMTNDEMSDFIKLNNDIVDNTPNVTSAISDQGNAYIDNLEVLKDLNAEKREELLMDASRELEKALDNENKLLRKQKELNDDIKEIGIDIKDTQQERISKMEELEKEEQKQKSVNEEIKQLKKEIETLDGNELVLAQAKLNELQLSNIEHNRTVESIESQKEKLDNVYDQLRENLKEKNESLDTTNEEIKRTSVLVGDYEKLILAQVGITSEKGRGLDALDEEIEKVKKTKKELEKNTDQTLKNTDGYKSNVRELDTQIKRLKGAKTELDNINTLAGKTIYDKEVNLKTNPSLSKFNQDLRTPVQKMVDLYTNRNALRLPGLAVGTDYHQGGPALVGEEGPELARLGNRWSMLDFGITDLPRGTQVFTHDETKDILKSLNRIPAYATGISSPGSADRVVGQLNNQQPTTNGTESRAIYLLGRIAKAVESGQSIQIDGNEVIRVTRNKIDEGLSDVGNRRNAAWGGA